MPYYDSLIFDGSGTILDDLELTWNAMMEVSSEFDIEPICREDFRDQICTPAWNFFEKKGVDIEGNKRKIVSLFKRSYEASEVRVFPDVIPVLDDLLARGKKMGMVSHMPRDLLLDVLEREAIKSFFDIVITLEDTVEQKPSPNPLMLALDELGTDPRSSVYVGDMREDIEAAHRAGLAAIGVCRSRGSYHRREMLLASDPDWIVEDFRDLLHIAKPAPRARN